MMTADRDYLTRIGAISTLRKLQKELDEIANLSLSLADRLERWQKATGCTGWPRSDEVLPS